MATFDEIRTSDADDPQRDGVPPGVPKALFALVGALLAVSVSYVLPGDRCLPRLGDGQLCVDDLRPWVPSDGPPFAKHFRTDGVGPQTAEASGAAAGAGELSESERALLAQTEALGDDDAEAVDEPAIRLAPAPSATAAATAPAAPAPGAGPAAPGGSTPAAPAPGATPDAAAPAPGNATAGAAPEPAPGGAPAAPPAPHRFKAIQLPPASWQGVSAEIADPSGAMRPFYEALARTALREPGAVTRISHWGDSTIAADGMTSMARRLLQRQFGDSGHGFVLAEAGTDWYVHKDVEADRKGWKATQIISGLAKDGRYGYGGAVARGYLGATATWGTARKGPVGRKVGRFDLYLQRGPKYGDLSLRLDGGDPVILSTGGAVAEDFVHSLRVPDGPHALKIRVEGGGPVKVYGVVMERERPGVVYDCLGMVGARGSRVLNFDEAHFQQTLRTRKPDLMIIHFGGNELVDEGMKEDWYLERFEKVVRRFRQARPEAACLVMSPIDHGEKHRGRIRTKPDLLRMIPWQQRVAKQEGCAFLSMLDAMGGEGSMGRWYRASPRLGWADLAHTTAEGSRVLGSLFYKSLMRGFADYLAGL